VTGTAQRYEGGALVVTSTGPRRSCPGASRSRASSSRAGDRVRCLILDVRDAGSQVKIVLSRAHPDFIKRLFEVEVPEVAEKHHRDQGDGPRGGVPHQDRGVVSVDSKVDAVGACVGVRGSRIKNIVDELNGEKIDIVRWNESSQILISNALKPAEVQEDQPVLRARARDGRRAR
jgi:N utilization substance protein A